MVFVHFQSCLLFLDGCTDDDIETKFWKTVQFQPALYGADMPGTLLDEKLESWNIQKLGTKQTCFLVIFREKKKRSFIFIFTYLF